MRLKNILIILAAGLCLAVRLTATETLLRPARPDRSASLEPFEKVELRDMERFRRELTVRFIAQLRDPGLRALLASRLEGEGCRTSLNQLVRDWAETWPSPERRRFAALVAELDQDLRGKMGIEPNSRGILGLELLWPEDGPRRLDWDKLLCAVRPREAHAQSPQEVDAYDLQGRLQVLDPKQRPTVPVLLLGADRREVVRAGLETVNQGLARAGFSNHYRRHDPTAPLATAKLTHIRMAEGQESWWRDGLEVYALVAGVDPVQAKPNIRLVNLPYLRHEAADYYPNQVLLFWSDFRYAAANIQFFDHGDGTDYQELLSAVLKGVAAAMTVGGAPGFAWIPVLADAIVEALPARWWKDSDTWLDTFYTVEQGKPYVEQAGAAQTVTLSLVPWLLKPTD